MVGDKLGHTKSLHKRLRKYKVPTHTVRWGKVSIKETYAGDIVEYKTYRALITKRFPYHTRDREVAHFYPTRSDAWKKNFIKSLKVIFRAIFQASIDIKDLQLVVDEKGRAFVTDPLSIRRAAKPWHKQTSLSTITAFFDRLKIPYSREMKTWKRDFPRRYWFAGSDYF